MMKKIIFTISVLVSGAAYSQVGIDTETPKATLDVTGKPSDLTKVDGIIAPRLKGSELKAKDALYIADQKASLVYVTEALASADTTSKTINVTSIGYFYFDGNIWQKLTTGSNGAGGNDWSILGNSGTTAGTNFIGTTDAVDFVVKTNNTERERTYEIVNSQNEIKKITGGNLNVNGVSVGTGNNNDINSTAVGRNALKINTNGIQNVAVGANVLYKNTDGYGNVAVGMSAMPNNVSGFENVAIGQHALYGNVTGNSNVAVGTFALGNFSNSAVMNNVAIGQKAGELLTDGASNIVVGAHQNLASTTGSNQLNIGGVIFGTGLTGTEAAPAGNIGIGTTTPATRLEVNNGTTNGAVKIVDGTQAEGKVLTSDASGLATWQNPKALAIKGEIGGYNVPFETNPNYRFTGATITLPPGKWLVTITQYAYITGYDSGGTDILLSPDDWMITRTTFSDQTNVTTIGQTASPSADVSQPSTMTFTVHGPHRGDAKTGVVYINNTSNAPKIYKYIAGGTEAVGPLVGYGGYLNNFAGNWSENSITAVSIN